MRLPFRLGALLALALAGPAAALDVCVEGAYPPFSEVTADGAVKGFDIDIASALCAELGEDCVFKLTRWERMIPALTGGVVAVSAYASEQFRPEEVARGVLSRITG